MKFTDAQKKVIVARREKGESVRSLCSEFNIPRSTLYRWCKSHKTNTIANGIPFTAREINQMQNRIVKLNNIIAILKTANCTVSAPLRERLGALESLYSQYDVYTLCEALEVDRGTFYNHIRRNKRENAWFAKRREKYRQIVQEVFDEYHQVLGSEKIRAILVERGHKVSAKFIASIMRECGLYSIRTTAKSDHFRLNALESPKNRIRQNFTAHSPNQIWVSDITSFKVNDYWVYLCVILDLFSRKIVGYRVSRNASTNLVTSTFRTAFRERGNPREALIKSVAVDGERFFVKTRFEKRRNTVCTREGHARIRMAPLSPTAATYFSFFKPPDWQKRSVVRGRGFIQRFPSSLTFHSDRGKQYTSAAFTALLQKCGVKQSFSATARPHDNAVAETFFASFKKEEAYRREYTSEQSYRKRVEQYIQFYNELRPHRTLKYKTPQAIEETYQERL